MDDKTKANNEERNLKIFTILIIIAIFLFHATRTLGYYPLNLPDEFTYNFDSRHTEPSKVIIPNYLYYVLIKVCDLFGARYYDAVKVINSFVLILCCPFIYKISRMTCSVRLSLFLSVIGICWPISIYTSQFWPEIFYFTGAFIFFWVLMRWNTLSPLHEGIVAGACIGLLSLIKVHGIFLLPGYLLFLVLTNINLGFSRCLQKCFRSFFTCICAFLLVKFGFSFLYAGKDGLRLLGSGYESLADEGIEAIYSVSNLIRACLYNSIGHLLNLSLALGVPLLGIAYVYLERTIMPPRLKRLCTIALSFLLPLMFVSISFAGVMAQLFPTEDPAEEMRIQARYYSFIFPLFPIIAAGVMTHFPSQPERLFRKLKWFCFGIAGLAIFAAFSNFYGFDRAILEDYCEGAFLEFSPIFPLVIAAIGVTACFLSFVASRKAFQLYLFVYLPLFSATCICVLHIAQTMRGIFPVDYDYAGIYARNYLNGELHELAVVDRWYHSAKKAIFHLDNPNVTLHSHFETDTVDITRIPPDKNWILSFSGLRIPKEYDKYHIEIVHPALAEEWETLVQTNPLVRVRLTRITDFDYSCSLDTTNWAWPVKEVKIENSRIYIFYQKRLPKRMRLKITIPTYLSDTQFKLAAGKTDLGIFENGSEKIVDIPNNASVLTIIPIRDECFGFNIFSLSGIYLQAEEYN